MTDGVTVRRRPDGLGLVALRAGLPPTTLVTRTPTHVAVRTPGRPDFYDGNALDLDLAPEVDGLDRWLARAVELADAVGAPHVRLRWEVALGPAAPPAPPAPPAGLMAALAARGAALDALTVLALPETGPTALAAPIAGRGAPAGLVVDGPLPADGVVGEPGAEGAAGVDRRWHGAAVLHRYDDGDTPEAWRRWDEDGAAWMSGVTRDLARRGRARVWLAVRHGIPVGTVTLVDDGTGASVVEDLVVHPAHRGRGVAEALERAAVTHECTSRRPRHVLVAVVPGSVSDRLHRRLGFVPAATVWVAHVEGRPRGVPPSSDGPGPGAEGSRR